MSKTKKYDLKIIRAVKHRKFLYDKNHLTVPRTRDLVKKTWHHIAKEVNLPKKFCENRWKSLRTQYTRSVREQSSWFLAPYLTFLKPFISHRSQNFQSDPTNGAAKIAGGVKRNQSKGPSVCSNLQEKKNEKTDKPGTNVQAEPASSALEKQSNQSFCESLSSDLQTLYANKQLDCRIDILKVVNQYKNPMVKKAISRSDEKIYDDISNKFASILDKIKGGKSFDEDWLFIHTATNFVRKLSKMRKTSSELNRILPSFEFKSDDDDDDDVHSDDADDDYVPSDNDNSDDADNSFSSDDSEDDYVHSDDSDY